MGVGLGSPITNHQSQTGIHKEVFGFSLVIFFTAAKEAADAPGSVHHGKSHQSEPTTTK